MATVEAKGKPAAAPAQAEKSAAAPTVHKVPLPTPHETAKAPPRPVLTEAEQTKYNWLLEQMKNLKEVPSQKGKAGPLSDKERAWLTRECLLRYLRATKWHEKDAEKRLIDTLSWRRDYGVDSDLTPEHVSPENETGKQVIAGFDKECRPCLYLRPALQNTQPSPRQVQHFVYMVERVIDMMPAGVETLSLMVNYQSSTGQKSTGPSLQTGREVLHILQSHYPERLGRALIINVPWVVWGFFKLIMPFIDPHTREKLKFNEDMRQYVPESQLLDDFKGSVHLDYEHGVYWPALWEAASQRRAERYRRWEEGGRHIGEFEDYLAGGLAEGVAATLGKAAEEKAKPVETTPAATEPAPAPAAAETKVEEVPKTAALVVETAVDAVAEDAAKLKLAEGAKA